MTEHVEVASAAADPVEIRMDELEPAPELVREQESVVEVPDADTTAPTAEVARPPQVARPTRPPHVARPTRPPHMANPALRRALMPWVVIGGLLVSLGAIAIGLTYTPIFHAKSITVSGDGRLSEGRVLKIAGIGPRTDVFHLDLSGVERRLERNPWIADAVVTRHLPSSVSVAITERRPVALTASGDGTLLYVAPDGHVLIPAPMSQAHLLPEVLSTASATPDASTLAAGASVAGALPRTLRPQVASIAVDGAGSVLVTLRSGVTATYGDASHAEAKGEALKAVLDWAAHEGKHLTSVDLEVPGAPTAVLVGAVVTSPHLRP